MAISFPTLKETINKAKTGIKSILPNSNPWLRDSLLSAIATTIGGRVYDFYYNLQKNVLPNLFLTTATDSDIIEDLVAPFSITRRAATQSNGYLIATGLGSTIIPVGTQFQDSNGNIYTSQTLATIASSSITITSLTQIGGLATAISVSHGLSSGVGPVTISGANETDYNGNFAIIVIDEDSFSYEIDSSAPSSATGTIIATSFKAEVYVISDDYGSDLNLDGGETVSITSPISGVDDELYVKFPSFSGGTDIESDDDLRERGLVRYRKPSGAFTVGDIEQAVKTDVDNTRVWVQDITPNIGQVTVYFVRDNDGTGTSILPSSTYIAEAVTNIEAIAPAIFDSTNDLFVNAPTPITINFTFTSITPSTTEMQTAIEDSLKAFFEDTVDLGENITEIEYNSAIINTIDETGTKLTSFTLSSPSGDVSISDGELGILGSITF